MSSVFITESGDKLAAIFLPLSSTALGLQASVRLHSALFIGSVVQTQALTLIQQELCPMSHLSSSGSFFLTNKIVLFANFIRHKHIIS